jgi:hypothetical protein
MVVAFQVAPLPLVEKKKAHVLVSFIPNVRSL